MIRRPLRVALTCLLTLSVATRAYAILGLGDIVFDPTAFVRMGEQLLQMEQQYAQLVQNYQMLRSQYDHWVTMARQVPVVMGTRYRTLVSPWRTFSANDTYGSAGAWIQAVNTGQGLTAGYARSTEPLSTYGSALGALPSSQAERLKTTYGSVELTDGANLNALGTIGQLRANARGVEATIQHLEDDSLSGAAEMNTEIAVLNKLNAASMVAVRRAQDTNQLLVALTEQQVLYATRVRDAEARAINQHVRFVTDGRAVVMAQGGNASQALRDWRMP